MKREDDFFINLQKGTSFFIGVVEDIHDEAKLNRVRVRVLGLHPEDRTEVPTEALPWATIMLPVSVPNSYTHSLRPNTWVILFFIDGMSCQDPVIIGQLSGIATPAPIGGSFASTISV